MKQILPIMLMCALPMASQAQHKSGLVEKNFNKSVRPQDDFYEFATGGWQKNNPLPAAFSRFGSLINYKKITINVLIVSLVNF